MEFKIESAKDLLMAWDRRALKAVDAHYESARHYSRFHGAIGIPTIVLAAAISALAFATIGHPAPLWVQMTIGFLGLTQAVLASLHTWLRYADLAEKHRQAGARYAAIRRHVAQIRTMLRTVTDGAASEIREALDTIAREAPSIPARISYRTQEAFKGQGTAAGKILSATDAKGIANSP